VQAASALRVAVVDRDPSAVSSLSLPAGAVGQRPAASHGPVSVEIPDAQLTVSKWLIVYLVPVQMVSFVRGATIHNPWFCGTCQLRARLAELGGTAGTTVAALGSPGPWT